MAREKPDTIEECVNQLWYALIGTNGEGLIERFNGFLVNREKTCPVVLKTQAIEHADEKNWRRRNDIIKSRLAFSGWAAFALTLIMLILKLLGVIQP